MNTILKSLIAGSILAASSFSSAMAADTYTLDPMHTAVTFHINHFGFSNPSGKFMNIEGSVTLDEKNPAASTVSVTIPLAKVDTGIAKLDEHLASKDFFDTATYPTATFVSKTVSVTGKDTAIVHGDLTLHGVTKPVDLQVRLNQIGENMMKKRTAGFSAHATLNRSDFGITTYLPALGDQVALDIESEANVAIAK